MSLWKLLPLGWRLKLHPRARKFVIEHWGEAFLNAMDWRGRVDWFEAVWNEPDEEKRELIINDTKRVILAKRLGDWDDD